MKKLIMLASALALTLCMGQSYAAEEPAVDQPEENSAITSHYSDSVTTDKTYLIEKMQIVIRQFENDEAKHMFDVNIPDWLGYASGVADSLRDALTMTNADSDEIKEAEDFVKEVSGIWDGIDYNTHGVVLSDGYDEAEQDSINAIKEKIPAKIEKLKVLLDQLNSGEIAPKADESVNKDEESISKEEEPSKEVSENDSKIEVEESAVKETASEESSDVESEAKPEEIPAMGEPKAPSDVEPVSDETEKSK